VRWFEVGLIFVLVGSLFSQSNPEPPSEPRFAELSRNDGARLDRQRGIVAAAAKRYGMGNLTKTKKDLSILQKLIDLRVFKKSQTYELQSLGVAFGDVMSSELSLRWVMVTDEYGTDPTLRFKKTALQINALTMISRRIEADQPVDLSELLRKTREQVARVEQESR